MTGRELGPLLDGAGRWGICPLSGDLLLEGSRKRRLLPQSGSVIFLTFPYYTGEHIGQNLSHYAVPADYHAVAGGMLDRLCGRLRLAFPDNLFISFVDSSPLREVEGARRAGLGAVGQNGQLITREFGSLVFIGEVVTDLILPYSEPSAEGCLGCGRCEAACPTGALKGGRIDVSRCLSAITQRRGELTDWERRQLAKGGLAWGCDRCTMACPHNRAPVITPIAEFISTAIPRLDADRVNNLSDRAYLWRGREVLLRNLSILSGRAK